MKLKQAISKILPISIKLKLKRAIVNNELKKIGTVKCNTEKMLSADAVKLEDIFNSSEIQNSWLKFQDKIDSFKIQDFTGGVNPGDRKAIFSLIRYFKPRSVLEIGTHIGASTVNIASALHFNHIDSDIKPIFRTLDIKDVNSVSDKPWLNFGAKYSPAEMIKNLGFESFVEFITDTSFNYLTNNAETYDLIFLDGDHSAKTVYQEVCLASKKLNKGGIILLHDYFPNGEPLWLNKYVIHGPYLAIRRYINEGAEISIIPLGDLPWPTKLNSNATSLALLLKK